MNGAELKAKWKQLTGEAKRQWGKLTDDDLKIIEGDKDKLVGKIQERYGKSRDEAEREVNAWIEKQDQKPKK
ncbi:CsbD family protein [Marinicauda algicola]|uniref:CsbD family protein n=1 Tax=Marinicauda algicola TaxID=2029849 RepID=A0A4S2H4G8_9PROT|nr:CsbD family protein [Marinicauda algicola]TGY90555.1 CsbD family protein [Marinicauda algicola]